MTDPISPDATSGEPLAPASGKKARRRLPASTRRILFVILGVFVAVASVAGFYFTSDAFDQRTPVLVAAVDIQEGETVTAGYFTSELAVMGSIPHIPYTPEAPFAFEGLIATQPIPAGTVVLASMMIFPETQPVGNQLAVTVSFDTSLVESTRPGGDVFEGDRVLLVDPGREPAGDDFGRPRATLQSLTLRNYQDATMTMFLGPEEWAWWQELPDALGAAPMILPVPTGGTAEEFAREMDALWLAQWEEKAMAAAALPPVVGPQPGPGEVEVVVNFDTSLQQGWTPREGDRVLMIDPGRLPTREDIGRARRVLRTIVLENFNGTAMQLFLAPEEWAWWRGLPDALGAAPMILPIPGGTDVDDMIGRLNSVWNDEWELAVNELNAPEAG